LSVTVTRSPAKGFDSTTWLAVLALGVTQITGWGTTFYIPAVLVRPLSGDLGLSRDAVFGGVTAMLLVSAATATIVKPIIERWGARGAMALGSALMAVGLVILSRAGGLAAYILAWLVFGAGAPLALSQSAYVALSLIAHRHARRAMGGLMLISSLSSTLFWPLTAWLEVHLGWRLTCLGFAGLHLFLCLPLHALLPKPSRQAGSGAAPIPGAMPSHGSRRRRAFILATVALSLAGFVSWGLPLHVIEIMRSVGHPTSFAVLAATMMGPGQTLALFAEMLVGHRVGILTVGAASLTLMLLSLLLAMAAGTREFWAIAFALSFGLAAQAVAMVRVFAPLHLFGSRNYAAVMGQLGVPQNIVFALAPTVFAMALQTSGPTAALLLASATTVLALVAMLLLVRVTRPDGPGDRPGHVARSVANSSP